MTYLRELAIGNPFAFYIWLSFIALVAAACIHTYFSEEEE